MFKDWNVNIWVWNVFKDLTLEPLRTQVAFGSVNLPATPESRTLVNHEVPLAPVAPVQVQVLVLETEERLVLALPVLQDVALVALKEQNLDPVFDLSSAQAQLQLETEDAILRDPAELLLLGAGIADSHSDGGSALHLHTLVVVLIVDQKGAAVWRRATTVSAAWNAHIFLKQIIFSPLTRQIKYK